MFKRFLCVFIAVLLIVSVPLTASADVQDDGVDICGPVPLSVVKINDLYRYRLVLTCRPNRRIRQVLSAVLNACSRDSSSRNVSFYIENDPVP